MDFKLRDYQQEIIDQVRSSMKTGCKSILIQSPTGSGKTALTAFMMKTASAKHNDSWFIVHRRELINQSVQTFSNAGVEHGVIASGFNYDESKGINVCSIGTLARRYDKVRPPKLIIWDECHHIAAGTWEKIYKYFDKSFHIGLSATPQRLDGRGLGDFFHKMIEGPSVDWLIDQGFLSKYRMYAPSTISTDHIRTQMGDYKKSDAIEAVDKPSITGNAINEYTKLAYGKRAVVFCISIEHSKHVVEEFNNAGITARHIDGTTPTKQRDELINDFRQGKIKVLSNVDLFGEGFDLPAMEVAILLRPTKSLGLYLQQVGRVLRPSPGKDEAIILDHVGNVMRHGLPETKRDWSLTSEKRTRKSDNDNGPPIRLCPICFAAQLAALKACKFCNHVFELEERKIEEIEGNLVEIDKTKMKRKLRKEQAMASTLEDLQEIGRQRGYKPGWAYSVWKNRKRRR